MARLRTAILISGRGSNMRRLIAACQTGEVSAEVALVLSSQPRAEGLAHAAAAGIATAVVDRNDFPDRDAFDSEMDRRLKAANIEFICLAGFMRLLSRPFVEGWRDRMINIHPSLLPAFPGLDTHRRAIESGARFAGCTVHFVRYETDTGPIIVQAAVPIRAGDTPDSLAARVLTEEHRLYPMALRWVAEGRVRIMGERAIVDGVADAGPALINPVAG